MVWVIRGLVEHKGDGSGEWEWGVGVGVGGDLIVDDACFMGQRVPGWHRLCGEFSAHNFNKSTNHTHCHEARARFSVTTLCFGNNA